MIVVVLLAVEAWAESPCAMCHPKEALAYQRSPMGRSLSAVNTSDKTGFSRGASRFSIDGAQHSIQRGARTATHSAVWQIGSGSHAAGFLVQISGALFQSPAAYYPGKRVWDVAPGYEALTAVDFNRRVTEDCLGCHSNAQPGTLRAIDCERCHGDGDAHALRPAKSNIVNPARLPAIERASVCEQCHITGVARIPQPGAAAFQPGRKLEDSLAVFVQPSADLKVVSHVEQLALSKCGPNLWCGSCHQPHGEPVSIDATCKGCHTQRPNGHASSGCANCHMPKRRAVDGLHTAFTDHRISRPGQAARVEAALRPWRVSPNAQRNEGLARLAAGDMQGAFRILTAAYAKHPKDPEVLASIGFLLFLKDQHADAVKLLRAAIALKPEHAPYHQKLALALRAGGSRAQATSALELAIRFDPLDETNYHLLAEIEPARRREILERYLRINPQHLATREALAR